MQLYFVYIVVTFKTIRVAIVIEDYTALYNFYWKLVTTNFKVKHISHMSKTCPQIRPKDF